MTDQFSKDIDLNLNKNNRSECDNDSDTDINSHKPVIVSIEDTYIDFFIVLWYLPFAIFFTYSYSQLSNELRSKSLSTCFILTIIVKWSEIFIASVSILRVSRNIGKTMTLTQLSDLKLDSKSCAFLPRIMIHSINYFMGIYYLWLLMPIRNDNCDVYTGINFRNACVSVKTDAIITLICAVAFAAYTLLIIIGCTINLFSKTNNKSNHVSNAGARNSDENNNDKLKDKDFEINNNSINININTNMSSEKTKLNKLSTDKKISIDSKVSIDSKLLIRNNITDADRNYEYENEHKNKQKYKYVGNNVDVMGNNVDIMGNNVDVMGHNVDVVRDLETTFHLGLSPKRLMECQVEGSNVRIDCNGFGHDDNTIVVFHNNSNK
jgi:hypothetical protein